MLVQHPVLLIFFCPQVRSMKLSNARLPLPEGENHEPEQCHYLLVQHPVLLVFLFCLQLRTMKLSKAIIG